MLHEALMLEIYRQALNAGALPTVRPESTDSANSSERCPSRDSNFSENGKELRENSTVADVRPVDIDAETNVLPMQTSPLDFFPITNLPIQPPPSMEAYLHMVAAAAQQYGFPLGITPGSSLQLPVSTHPTITPFKVLPPTSPSSQPSNNYEALDFRTNICSRFGSTETTNCDMEMSNDDNEVDINNPLDLSVASRKRLADDNNESDSTISKLQLKKVCKVDIPSVNSGTATTLKPPNLPPTPILPTVNPYLAAVAAANIFRSGQLPDWNGKNNLVVDPLDKMCDIVKSSRKEKSSVSFSNISAQTSSSTTSTTSTPTSIIATSLPVSNEVASKTRHNIWQSHWQNKGVANCVFRCVWCKQSFPTLEALTAHMKDSKHCGVNVPPFSNVSVALDRTSVSANHTTNNYNHIRSTVNKSNVNNSSNGAKSSFQYRGGDTQTPLPRKLVRGQNVWLGKGVEQAMQILKCMRCGESFRSLSEMTKHMQETQHYANILSQEQSISMKSSLITNESKEVHNSLSSEESRTLSAVLTCKVCDKPFNSLGDLSNHMAKNNHYTEPLMQSIGGSSNRKRSVAKKREKSLPVRKLLEMKAVESVEHQEFDVKIQHQILEHHTEKQKATLLTEHIRQYITGMKTEEPAKVPISANVAQANHSKNSDIVETKNGMTKSINIGTSSVLSAIEQMFTTSFDVAPKQSNMPSLSPSNSSIKNISPVASNILKRLGIDENVDYNKPLIDTMDPYFQPYRYTSSERSVSECSGETHVENLKLENSISETMHSDETIPILRTEGEISGKKDSNITLAATAICDSDVHNCSELKSTQFGKFKVEIKTEVVDGTEIRDKFQQRQIFNANDNTYSNSNVNNNIINNNKNNSGKEYNSVSPSALQRYMALQSPTDSHRSITPKSPASSIKSYEGGDKKYPSDSLNALSSMFDSLGSTASSRSQRSAPTTNADTSISHQLGSPNNHNTSSSLTALRQLCIKKEKPT